MFNIFHPHDPVAYRVEPLIDPRMAAIPPVLIPHHKGRKIFPTEVQETVSKFTSTFKQKYQDGQKTIISAVQNRFPPLNSVAESMEPAIKEENQIEELEIGFLNEGRRIDYVLQESPLESIGEYFSALFSHFWYWRSEDTLLLILKEIYSNLNIGLD
ncbi:hypothetical protein QYM36_006067 [Artemia franciscana]|uniref:DDHD domain-containing protein n=1 Tax=Artemia franciscana TaxID=6661 RepID=A0AA88I2Y6_ARTSF|nr:hypothetical protein QYM36_006067 [Artemia franciscana]